MSTEHIESIPLLGVEKTHARFSGWRDHLLTPTIGFGIVISLGYATYLLKSHFELSLFASVILFYGLLGSTSVLFTAMLRAAFAKYFEPAKFDPQEDPWRAYVAFNLHGFFLITFLAPFFDNLLLPVILRKEFYRLLGTKFGPGFISIGGKIADPHLTTIEQGVIIGDGALVLGHAFNTVGDRDQILFGRVHFKKSCIIGARSLILPGVTVGEHSMVQAMSLVPRNTTIPPYELWGGHPAKKIRSLRKAVVS